MLAQMMLACACLLAGVSAPCLPLYRSPHCCTVGTGTVLCDAHITGFPPPLSLADKRRIVHAIEADFGANCGITLNHSQLLETMPELHTIVFASGTCKCWTDTVAFLAYHIINRQLCESPITTSTTPAPHPQHLHIHFLEDSVGALFGAGVALVILALIQVGRRRRRLQRLETAPVAEPRTPPTVQVPAAYVRGGGHGAMEPPPMYDNVLAYIEEEEGGTDVEAALAAGSPTGGLVFVQLSDDE